MLMQHWMIHSDGWQLFQHSLFFPQVPGTVFFFGEGGHAVTGAKKTFLPDFVFNAGRGQTHKFQAKVVLDSVWEQSKIISF